MTDDLVQFLRDRLDEDDAAALAASWDEWDGSHWIAYHREKYDGRWAIIDRADEGVITTVDPQASADAPVAQHIARHDPARVLREVEAKRAVIRAHEKWCEGRCEAKFPEGGFDAAHYWSVKALAVIYANHPDYRDTWRP